MKQLYICDQGQVADTAALCRANEFGIEFQSFYRTAVVGDSDLVKIHRDAACGLRGIAMHGPIFGKGREFLCPADEDPEARRALLDAFKFTYEATLLLGGTHIVLHHAYDPEKDERRKWLSRFGSFWADFSRELPAGIQFHLENMLEHGPEFIISLLATISDEQVDACLDVGHVHCNSKTPVLKWIEELGSRIGYVHLHDNHGDTDEHLGLGMGDVQMEEVCHALEQHSPQATWAVECKAEYREHSLAWLRDRKYF